MDFETTVLYCFVAVPSLGYVATKVYGTYVVCKGKEVFPNVSCGRRGRMGCVAPAGPSKLGWVPRHC